MYTFQGKKGEEWVDLVFDTLSKRINASSDCSVFYCHLHLKSLVEDVFFFDEIFTCTLAAVRVALSLIISLCVVEIPLA